MVTPGLLPEASDRRPSPLPVTGLLLLLAAAAGLIYLGLKAARLKAERETIAAEAAALRQEIALTRPEIAKVSMLQRRILELEKGRPAAESPESPAPARAPDVRVLPPAPPGLAQERITQGLHEFRSGRFLQAELAFLRAVPEAYGYIVLTCFVRGDVREAVLFLGRALASDPEWLRRVKPRDLFGAPEEYEKALRALEERVARDPLDPEAKTLLAYFRLHDQGPGYAKALLVEAVNAAPGHAEAKRFLEALGP